MKASQPAKSAWQQYVEDVWSWYGSYASVLPDCPVLRGLAGSALRVQSDILRGSLWVTEFLLQQLDPPTPPRSEKITIE